MATILPPLWGLLVSLSLFGVIALMGVAVSPASATPIVAFTFNNDADGNNGFNYTTFDSSVLASAVVTKGPGLGQYSVNTDSLVPDVQVLKTGPGTTVVGASAATAFSNDWYFQFTLTPNTTMNIGSIQVDWSRSGTSGVRGWFVRSSLDSYTSTLYSNETPNGTAKGLTSAAFDISGFTGLSSATNFRFYMYTESSGRYMDFSNIQFNAPNAVPEPTTFLMVGIGLVGMCVDGIRSKKRGKSAG